jgi:LacI family transcriptional regulator
MLKRGIRSNFIGFITGDLANPFYSALAKGIERELRSRGLQLTIGSTDENADRERELFNELVARQVRAIIVVSTRESHEDFASAQEHGIPVVFVDRAAVGIVADSVLVDNRTGARSATEHLLAHGHRRIGFIGDFSRLPTHRDRLAGFIDALTAAGITDPHRHVREGAHDAESARRVTEELLAVNDPPTALFTSNNRLTIGALGAIRGLETPPALVGFDDFDLADVLAVTVVSHDTVEMGRRAAQIVLETISTRQPLGEHVVMTTRLIERGSGEVAPGESWR